MSIQVTMLKALYQPTPSECAVSWSHLDHPMQMMNPRQLGAGRQLLKSREEVVPLTPITLR